MRIGIHSPYLDTLGGGERYILTAAEFFLKRGDDVEIFWDKGGNLSQMSNRFGLELGGARFSKNIFNPEVSLIDRARQTRLFDVILVLSDGSIPFSFAKKNLIHLQVPFQKSNRPKLINKLKLRNYTSVLCNSHFTKKIIDQTYDVNSTVLYPPVDVARFKPTRKEKIILSVGRFFVASHLHNFAPKKQKEMIETFKLLVDGGLKGWKLVLLGANAPDQVQSLEDLKSVSVKYPIEISSNVNYEILKNYFGKASIYWHAAGFGEDLKTHPERAEHFGITTVEAMSAGAVPLSFAGGGQLEIISAGNDGFLWQTLEELQQKTKMLIQNPEKIASISKNAIAKSKQFNKQNFYFHLEKILQ